MNDSESQKDGFIVNQDDIRNQDAIRDQAGNDEKTQARGAASLSEIDLSTHKSEGREPLNHSGLGGSVDQALNLQRNLKARLYSEQEIQLLYELGRLFLENGEQRKAEIILKGIVSVDPTFKAAWLGLAYLYHYNSQIDEGIVAAKKVLELEPGSVEGALFLVIFMYSSGEISASGAILGEIREKVESGLVKEPNIIRIYRSQLERFSSR